ncbi:uncharacterized protein [Diadema antillarum]|uniref:uncharacterized protein n=1 Tax=Diadema antillarum TaxID=105358 RepID=UPI003A875DA9
MKMILQSCDGEREHGPALQFSNLSLHLGDHEVLKNVSGRAEKGNLLAVMGPSGAGKTVLLTALAGRQQGKQTGLVLLKGRTMDKTLRRRVSFVLQEDLLFDQLTLRETLMFTAQLRLSQKMTMEEKIDRVSNIVNSLGLRKCLNTKIGNSLARGLSGGEKKRATIACELLTDPTMLLLDEPTSGLDSNAASELIVMLKKYARKYGKVVVASVHQPSSQTFLTFDDLLLLTDGEVVYCGPAENTVDYFSRLGLRCLTHYNPADFITLSVDGLQTSRKSITLSLPVTGLDTPSRQILLHSSSGGNGSPMRRPLSTRYSIVGVRQSESMDTGVTADKWPTSFWHQLSTLSDRNFRQYRSIILSRVALVRHLVLGLFVGAFYFRVEHAEERIRDMTGLERPIINRERSAGAYRLSSYFFSKIISELPLKLTLPFFSTSIVYWLAGLHGSPGVFIAFEATLLLNNQAAQAFGLLIGACSNSIQAAIAGGSICMQASLLLGGFYVSQFPMYVSWLRYLSIISYSYGATLFVVFALEPQPIRCSTTVATSYQECRSDPDHAHVSGLEIFNRQAAFSLPLWAYYGALCVAMMTFYLLAYFALRVFQKPS